MGRAVAKKRETEPLPAAPAEAHPRPRRRTAQDGAENARVLQQRLEDVYSAPAVEGERELSAFSRLTVIVGASALLWGAIIFALGTVV